MSPVLEIGSVRMWGRYGIALFGVLTLTLALPLNAEAAPDIVFSHQKISDTQGNFDGVLDNEDRLGAHVERLGDLDGDGVVDIAVAAAGDDDGGENCGAVWILFLNSDGSVKVDQKICATDGGFVGPLAAGDRFGHVASMGDLDGDGITDLAVGADLDDDGGVNKGAVWILRLNSNGTVKAEQKISDLAGGFLGSLSQQDHFGWSVAGLPDLDGDGVLDLAVGAPWDDDGANQAGAVWILFLNTDGTVKGHQKISATKGGFNEPLEAEDTFGDALMYIGDLEGDGFPELAVNARRDDDGGTDRGAIWILSLRSDGKVQEKRKISDTEGNFAGVLQDGDHFGRGLASLPDLNGDGVPELAVGEHGDAGEGALWILFLNADGTVYAHQKIGHADGGFTGNLDAGDEFGWGATWLGDLNGDGYGDLAVGAFGDDNGGGPNGYDRGAVWILFLGDPVTAAPGIASPVSISFAASPNPIRNHATFRYVLSAPSAVRLSVFGPQGRRVATLVDRMRPSGTHTAIWSGRNDAGSPVGAGVYFAKLEAEGKTAVRKIVVVK